MCTLISRNQEAEQAERGRLAQEWFDSRPKPPEGKRPNEMSRGIFGIIIPFALVGLIVGFTQFGGAFSLELDGLERALRFFAPLIGMSSGILIGWGIAAGIIAIHDRAVRIAPWIKYDSERELWELVGDEDLGQWATTNYDVASKLSFVSNHYTTDYFDAQRDSKPEQPKQYIDDELGDLERILDNATPGPVSSLNVPSVRRLARSAKHYAAIKRSKVKNGERFLTETRFPMRRSVGIDSTGWVSTCELNPEEEAEIVQYIRSVYGKYDLKVTKCWIGWTGMSVGSKGNYESFTLVIRLA